MEFHTVEGTRYRLYSHMSEEQSPPGYCTLCERVGPSGSSPKSTQKSGFNLRPPFLYQRPLAATCYLSCEEKHML